MSMKEAVQKGACRLDADRPGWAGRIDVDTLDLANAKNCILGQEYTRFSVGKDKLKIHVGSEYGFSLPMRSHHENARLLWKGLRQLWIEEIECRLLVDELEGVRTEEMAVV